MDNRNTIRPPRIFGTIADADFADCDCSVRFIVTFFQAWVWTSNTDNQGNCWRVTASPVGDALGRVLPEWRKCYPSGDQLWTQGDLGKLWWAKELLQRKDKRLGTPGFYQRFLDQNYQIRRDPAGCLSGARETAAQQVLFPGHPPVASSPPNLVKKKQTHDSLGCGYSVVIHGWLFVSPFH